MTRQYSSRSDVWSFGVMLWEVICDGAVPYASLDFVQLSAMVASGHRLQLPAACPLSLKETIASCWLAASERQTFGELQGRFQEMMGSTAHFTETYLQEQDHLRGAMLMARCNDEHNAADRGYDDGPRGSLALHSAGH